VSTTAFLIACDNPIYDSLCPDGEPVIPNYPSGPQNTFLGTESFKPCTLAKVGVCDNINDILDRLCTQFPGLPRTLHKAYVVETAVAVHGLSVGTRVRLFSTYDSAELTTEDGKTIRLWSKQPL
jgi:hypothetical protein